MARLSPPRVRMPRVTRPGRASRAASEKTTATEAATEPKDAAKEGSEAKTVAEQAKPADTQAKEATPATKPAASAPVAPGAKSPDPKLQERIEGLQGWMAELEHKQARTAYFGAVAVLIAIAAAGVALYFGVTNKNDSATKGDVDALKSRVDALQSAVTKNSKDTQNTINDSISRLQTSIQAVQKQQAQDAANISTLQSQAKAGAFSNKAANSAGAAAGTAVPNALTPGATTTTTPKKP
jgi:uncharacterized protein HemX